VAGHPGTALEASGKTGLAHVAPVRSDEIQIHIAIIQRGRLDKNRDVPQGDCE
jgi:hypothetical protein